MIERTLMVGVGGFVGAAARYVVAGLVHRSLPADLPYGTLVVNVSGCFGVGLLGALAEERILLPPEWRLFLMVGVLGGYTTFSTFGYETIALARDGSHWLAAANATANVLVCLLAVWAGAVVARVLP